ncbi:MAG: tetratricopeptide repeat protein, partial [Gammaproteobacteria bacterium]|nr:tetratricopeptide repeat protein [Gammaproteobacteria bacterium]
AAYAVVAWLLIQAASIVLPTFDTPPWIMQSLIVVTILGFPVALVLAWLYELTPMGLKRSDEVLRHTEMGGLKGRRLDGAIIGLLVVAVTFLAYDNYVSTAGRQADAEELDSIAVLAFENLSTEAEDEYFADGLADELLGALSRLRELKVASRTASFYFKGKDVDIMTIAATLQVGYVLSGRVRRYGDRIRVTAALDNAETSDLLWSESYDRELTDILDIQSEIARSVARAIVPVLSAQSERQFMVRPTENAEAYDYYLRGRDYLRQPHEETTLASAIELFDRAIDLDPRFAHAYAGLCEAHLGNYYFSEESESFEAAEVACHRALTLDNSLWDVHVALGNLYRYSGQYEDAILELETAIAQQPTAVSPYLELAQAYAAQNLLNQAEATFRRAEEVESRYWGVHNLFGNFLWDHSRYDEAIERYQRVIQLVPDSGVGYDNLGNTYLAMFELDQAERAFNASPLPSRWTYSNRGLVHYYRGEFSRAAEDHRRAVSISPEVHSSWGRLGDAYRFIPGEAENAHAAYEKAIELAEQDLSINPSDWDTLARLNTYYAFSGQLDRAAAGLEKLFELTSDPTAYFFAALVSVQSGNVERAYEYLRRTVESGWSRATIANDPDLASLRGEREFEAIIAGPTQ